ncbi:MAG: thioredoxin family protein [Rubrivivax sp.]|jgi:peroxiredoxin
MLQRRPALLTLAALACTAVFQAPAWAAATVGQPAPAFTAKDSSGKTVSLADFKGKHVVLEWTNPGCPFVQKHYSGGNMQATQAAATAQGVVWLTINSTHVGASDYKAPAAMAAWMQQQKAAATATLMDEAGTVGRAYGARTTPHLYVIDPAGKLVYAGAIDSRASSNPAHIASSTNHVKVALGEALAGKPISLPSTTPYGCSIKYADG